MTNVIAAQLENGEQFVFIYPDGHEQAVLRELGKAAADPELSFSWCEAAMLSMRVRELKMQRENAR